MELKIEDAIKRFVDNGIYCIELSDEHGFELLSRNDDVLETAKNFANFLKEYNFEISQGHLYLKVKICSDDKAIEALYKWIDLYEAIGIKNMVLHCDNMIDTDLNKAQKTEKNIENLSILADYVKGKNITICLENLRPHSPQQGELVDRNADDLLYIIDRIGSDKFGICLDTGHSLVFGDDLGEMVRISAPWLKVLHVHDNDGHSDQHLLPWLGAADWDGFARALAEIGYDGSISFETDGPISKNMPESVRKAATALTAEAARSIAASVDSHRS
jgi:sugar phosphate isomerase/epimerase